MKGEGSVSIDRRDQERVVYVSANLSGVDTGSVARDAERKLPGLKLHKDFVVAHAIRSAPCCLPNRPIETFRVI